MADKFNQTKRSWIMSRIKSKDTLPEILVRKKLFKMGYRYKIHDKNLPGRPDIVFVRYKKVIFIHGCFWHGHNCKRGKRIPKTNRDYWIEKVRKNRVRDKTHRAALAAIGWDSIIVWECEIPEIGGLMARIYGFLGNTPSKK